MTDITGQTLSDILTNEGSPGNAQLTDQLLIGRTVVGVPTNFTMTVQQLLNYNAGYTGTINETILTKLGESVSVNDFGAVGGGIIDDAAAIRRAIAAALAGGFKKILMPSTRYLIGSPIIVAGNFGYSGIEFVGNRTTITSSFDGVAWTFGSYSSPSDEYRLKCWFSGVTLVGPGTSNLNSVGILINETADVYPSNTIVKGFYLGVSGFGALICDLGGMTIRDNHNGIDFEPSTHFAPNDLNFTNCRIIANEVQAIKITGFPNGVVSFTGCEIEGNNTSGTFTDNVRVCEFTSAGEVNFVNCHIEANNGTYGVYYDGDNSTKTLNYIGTENISSNKYVTFVNSGQLVAVGGRIINGSATANIYLNSVANSYATINGTETSVSGVAGTLLNVIFIARGGIRTGQGSASVGIGAFEATAPRNNIITAGYANTLLHNFYNAAGTRMGYLGFFNGSSTTLDQDGNLPVNININGSARIQINRSASTYALEPGTDNTQNLGSGGIRWATVYAGTGTINTSDEREKEQIENIDSKVLTAWAKVNYTQFKYKDAVETKGDKARLHFGVIAQQVKEAFESEGLDPFEYGILCYDEWDEQLEIIEPEVLNEKGDIIAESHITQPYIPAGNRYGVRYEEALVLECAYLRSMLKNK